jgi:hypothetical protein
MDESRNLALWVDKYRTGSGSDRVVALPIVNLGLLIDGYP